jgi:hypothetical protein
MTRRNAVADAAGHAHGQVHHRALPSRSAETRLRISATSRTADEAVGIFYAHLIATAAAASPPSLGR